MRNMAKVLDVIVTAECPLCEGCEVKFRLLPDSEGTSVAVRDTCAYCQGEVKAAVSGWVLSVEGVE